MGEPVFSRTAQGVSLTPAGEVLLPYAKRVLAAYFEAASALENWRCTQRGKLILAGSKSVIHLILPSLMERLSVEFGVASMVAQECFSPEVVERVCGGTAVLGITFCAERHEDLKYQPVLRAQLGLLAPMNCPVPDKLKSLEDLNSVPMVRFGEHALITQVLRSHGISLDAYFNASVEATTSTRAMFPLLWAMALAMVASGISATSEDARDMRFLPLLGVLPTIEVALVSKSNDAFDPQLEILKELVREALWAFPWHESVQRIGLTHGAPEQA